MNLDDLTKMKELDPRGMYGEIVGLPEQLESTWNPGIFADTKIHKETIKSVIICGMGGSAIGGDLLMAYIAPDCHIPVIVSREYELPGWARGSETLVIASSHSGNTEETLSTFEKAREKGCQIIAISTGGELAEKAIKLDYPLVRFVHGGQPRAAVGYSFGLLLAVFYKLELISNPEKEFLATIEILRTNAKELAREIPVAKNPAKRLAGQLVGRNAVIFGSGILAPVARRWKTQINELAKSWAQYELLPEADHNTATGIEFPENLPNQVAAIFLESKYDHSRNGIRSEITRKHLMTEGFFTESFIAEGDSRLEQIWSALLFGDFVSYYLSAAYGVDPTPIPGIQQIKSEMTKASKKP